MLIDVCVVPWFLREPCGAPARHWFHIEAKGWFRPEKSLLVAIAAHRCI